MKREILNWLNNLKTQTHPIFVENNKEISVNEFLNDIWFAINQIKKYEKVSIAHVLTYRNVVILFASVLSCKEVAQLTFEENKKDFNNTWKFINYVELSGSKNTTEKVLEILNQYDEKKCKVLLSSSGSTGKNHYTPHIDDEIWLSSKIYSKYFQTNENKEYANIFYSAYASAIFLFLLLPMYKKITLHLIEPSDKTKFGDKVVENYVSNKNINILFVVGLVYFRFNNIKNCLIIHARALKEFQYDLIKEIIANNTYINVFASTDFLMEFLSIPKIPEEIGKFNVIKKEYTLDDTGELFYDNIHSNNRFELLKNGNLKFIGRTSSIVQDCLKNSEGEK